MRRREKLTGEERVALALDLIKGDGTLEDVCLRFNVSHTTAYKIRKAFLRGGREAVMGKSGLVRLETLQYRLDQLEQALGSTAGELEGRKADSKPQGSH